MGIRTAKKRKITILFPEDVLHLLDTRVPPRKRSAFIVDAVVEKLALEDQVAAIEESAGAWKEEDHPELRTPEDIDRWLSNIRAAWTREQEASSRAEA